jgi:heme A synthase
VKTLLRVAAALSLAWAIVLFLDPPELAGQSFAAARSLSRGLAIADFGFAYLFWRAARDPLRERTTIYAALLVLALRGANGTYEVLYLLEGLPALASLFDMVTSIALFVGILNTLPGTLHRAEAESTDTARSSA